MALSRSERTGRSDCAFAMSPSSSVRGLSWESLPARLGLASLAYFTTQILAFQFPDTFGLVAAIWPAAGVGLAVLLLNSRRHWPLFLACLFVAGMAANLTTGRPKAASFGFMVANMLETGASAWWMTRCCGDKIRFNRVREVLALVVAGCVINGVTSLLGAGSAHLAMGARFWTFYGTWWTADALGLLLITPLILVWTDSSPRLRLLRGWRGLEWAGVLALSWITTGMLFGLPRLFEQMEVRPYLLLVFLVWAAVRYGPRGTATLLGGISIIAIVCTAAGKGYFPLGGEDTRLQLLAVQTFLGVMGVTGLLLAAAVSQQHETRLELEESENRFRTYVEQAAEALFVHDFNGRFTEVNQRACERLGYTREELLRMTVCDVEQDFDLPRAQAAWGGLRPGAWCRLAGRHRRKDGTLFPVEASIRCFELDGRTLFMGLVQDLTERQRTEAALERNARIHKLLRQSILAINDCQDLDAALRLLVDKALEVSGLDCGAVYRIEGDFAVLQHQRGLEPGFVEAVRRRPKDLGYIHHALQNPREILHVNRVFPEQGATGQAYGLLHVYCVALSARGEPFGYLNVVSRRPDPPDPENIELIRILALELESTFVRLGIEQRLRSILTTMTDGVVVQSAEGRIIDCNPSAERILGLSREQIMGRTSVDPRWKAFREDGQPFPGEEHPAMVSLRTGKPCHDVMMRLGLPDGSIRWIRINSEPMFKVGEEQPHAVVATFTDMTSRKLMEDRMRQAQKLEGIGHLAGGMAHEFNNIFAAILMNQALAQGSASASETTEHLEAIESLTHKAAGLIKQLLAFSRQSVMELEPLDWKAAIDGQQDLIACLLGERIALEISTQNGLPKIHGDRSMLEQVLVNLCLNARDAMSGTGRLRLVLDRVQVGSRQAENHAGIQPGLFVRLSVEDSGCGMDERILGHLFEPFFTTKDVGKGTGLGLATVRGIVEQHRGWVEADSRVGQGSTFRVYLPACAEVPSTPSLGSSPVRWQPAAEDAAGTILLAEDDRGVRESTRAMLERRGYSVFVAADGDEARSLWQAHRTEIDLILSDVVMPGGMNGPRLARLALAEKPSLRVILISGYTGGVQDSDELLNPAVVYLAKPFSVETLIQTIRTLLRDVQPVG